MQLISGISSLPMQILQAKSMQVGSQWGKKQTKKHSGILETTTWTCLTIVTHILIYVLTLLLSSGQGRKGGKEEGSKERRKEGKE